PKGFIAMGNHRVYPSDETPGQSYPHAHLPEEAIAIAHVPIRSSDQITAKIAIGWLAHLAAHRDNPSLVHHWREAYEALSNGKRLEADELTAMAANYGFPRGEWLPADPATWDDEPFLANFTLKCGGIGRVDAFSALLKFA